MKLLSSLPLLAILSVASYTFAAPISTTSSLTTRSESDPNIIDELGVVLKDLGLGDAEASNPNLLDSIAKAESDLGL